MGSKVLLQNPIIHGRIQWREPFRATAGMMMNRSGADPTTWFKILEYATFNHNVLARKTNR